MQKFWLIFKHEYTRHVFRWRFLLIILSPVLMALSAIILMVLVLLTQINLSPVGYVDHARVIMSNTYPEDVYDPLLRLDFLPYPDEAAARDALDQKAIQAYYVIPADFHQTGKAQLVYKRFPYISLVTTQFTHLLRINLLANTPVEITRRVIEGSWLTIETTADTQLKSVNGLIRIIVPILMAYMVFFAIAQSSGYLVQAFAEERENRTIEILTTSASPSAIINGKLFGMVSVGLTQFLLWGGLPIILLMSFFTLSPVFSDAVNLVSIALLQVHIIASFILICGLIILIIVTFGEFKEGQNIVLYISLPSVLPFLFVNILSADGSSTLAMVLSFFPITASCTLALRLAFTSVPNWQILLGLGVQVLTTIAIFWLTTRAFRKSPLLAEKRVQWKQILTRIGKLRLRKSEARNAE